jgi:anti-sigma factor RsiW
VPRCSPSGWAVTDHVIAGLHCADAADLAAPFVLGALEPAETDAVRRHLAGCPEAHAEFADLGSVVPSLLETTDIVEPPVSLRGRILAAATKEQAGAQPQPVIERARNRPGSGAQQPGLPTLPGPRTFGRPLWATIGLAAALAVVALGAWNVQLRAEVAALTTYRNAVAGVIEQAAEPGAQLAVLAVPAGAGGPTGLAAVAGSGEKVSLVMRDLAPTVGTEVYEAWLIRGESAPIPLGSFTVDASRTAAFSTVGPAPSDLRSVTIALTREHGPGAQTPTLPIIAVGATGPT